jgi:hypothetical protein
MVAQFFGYCNAVLITGHWKFVAAPAGAGK